MVVTVTCYKERVTLQWQLRCVAVCVTRDWISPGSTPMLLPFLVWMIWNHRSMKPCPTMIETEVFCLDFQQATCHSDFDVMTLLLSVAKFTFTIMYSPSPGVTHSNTAFLLLIKQKSCMAWQLANAMKASDILWVCAAVHALGWFSGRKSTGESWLNKEWKECSYRSIFWIKTKVLMWLDRFRVIMTSHVLGRH